MRVDPADIEVVTESKSTKLVLLSVQLTAPMEQYRFDILAGIGELEVSKACIDIAFA